MKNLILKLVLALMLGTGWTGGAAVIDFTGGGTAYSASWSGSQTIADYPGAGVAFALNFAGAAQISDISITFTTTGGWNGDLYAYLSHGDGLAILLNKVGADAGVPDGYSTSGFNNITLGMLGTPDIHTVASPNQGAPYEADGRLAYTDTARANTLTVFSDANPNGAWTLYFSDLSPLNQSTLTAWNVNIDLLTPVPEPVNVALGVFGALFAGVGILRRFRTRRPAA